MAVARLVLAVAAPLVRAPLAVAITKQLKHHLRRQLQPTMHPSCSLALLQVRSRNTCFANQHVTIACLVTSAAVIIQHGSKDAVDHFLTLTVKCTA